MDDFVEVVIGVAGPPGTGITAAEKTELTLAKVPSGGVTGATLVKTAATDFAMAWVDRNLVPIVYNDPSLTTTTNLATYREHIGTNITIAAAGTYQFIMHGGLSMWRSVNAGGMVWQLRVNGSSVTGYEVGSGTSNMATLMRLESGGFLNVTVAANATVRVSLHYTGLYVAGTTNAAHGSFSGFYRRIS